jgi:glycosyltransferase involved in cell wall biosynthesis
MTDSMLPFVSVVIPCRNEARYIAGCLDSVLQNGYPLERMEVLIVDGQSEDGTQAIVRGYASQYPCIQLHENPGRVTPNALNIGIRLARGELIIRVDAHGRYAPGYLEKSVRYLDLYQADNVGGVLKAESQDGGLIATAAAYLMNHPLSGSSAYRVGVTSPQWSHTVWGGCYRREIFDRIGLFNEDLIKTQDREFNQRLREAGGRILVAPDICSTYYVRSTFAGYCKYVFIAGFWIFYSGKVSGRHLFASRNLFPLLALVLGVVLAAGSVAFLTARIAFALLILTYCAFCARAAVPLTRQKHDLRFLAVFPLVVLVTHLGYAIGCIVGLIRWPRKGRRSQSGLVQGKPLEEIRG